MFVLFNVINSSCSSITGLLFMFELSHDKTNMTFAPNKDRSA